LKASLLDILLCPNCGDAGLTLDGAQVVSYGEPPVEEIRSGKVVCPTCRHQLPVDDCVLPLVASLPKGVRADGEYWGSFYRWHYEHGNLGYFDVRQPVYPFLSYGVAEAIPIHG
jgi:uncharacterized protein YbaR (Trm112 family)